jgi:hydroxyacylglutathione hydrolase
VLKVKILPLLDDNYSYILYRDDQSEAIVIDAPDADPILKELKSLKKTLSHLLITHHHYDHTQGIESLKKAHNCQVSAPKKEKDKIPLLDNVLTEKDHLNILGYPIQVIETPGHTSGHIVYFFPENGYLFSGDTLFSLGCGRLFEGSPKDMYQSLEKLKKLPNETLVFFGHEYTLSNLNFSLATLKNDPSLLSFKEDLEKRLKENASSSPSMIQIEKSCNLFLRTDDLSLRKALNFNEESKNEEIFATLRNAKDLF